MLILTRKENECILIGNDIEIRITDIQQDQVKVGVTAPKDVMVYRKEIISESVHAGIQEYSRMIKIQHRGIERRMA
ncbi:MAG: carbon storage regulator [Sedimentisphaerales bacterium]|nr:carbon storage regulator [Sedimentisphaerales bacterium]